MTKTITIATKLREQNFGSPQPEDITHIAVTRIPTTKNEKVYLPVVSQERGAYWSVRPSGQSGYWWKFKAELPEEFDGLKAWSDETYDGDYVAEFAQHHAEYGYLPV